MLCHSAYLPVNSLFCAKVLICIGAYLYERIMKIGQSLKVQEQNWNMLFHVSLNCLVKQVQVSVGP